MILVDIFVPSIDRIYDFQLNENIVISTLIEEVCEMIEQKERVDIVGDSSELQLCDKDRQLCLIKTKTLADYGIKTGQSLILV